MSVLPEKPSPQNDRDLEHGAALFARIALLTGREIVRIVNGIASPRVGEGEDPDEVTTDVAGLQAELKLLLDNPAAFISQVCASKMTATEQALVPDLNAFIAKNHDLLVAAIIGEMRTTLARMRSLLDPKFRNG